MTRSIAFLTFAAISCTGAQAQMQPQPNPGAGDPRLQTVDYDPAQIVQLQGAPGYQLTVQLSPDEQVQNVAVGDSGAWQVSVNRAGDHLFIKPTRADVSTNMTVITSVRVYNFELFPLSGPSSGMPWNVSFRYPASAEDETSGEYVDVSPVLRQASRYKIAGDRSLRPTSVSDDGTHTYIRWPTNVPIPGIYEIAANGEERLVNGGMRGGDYVIDSVASRLIFRIDRKAARAVRLPPKRHSR